MVVLQIITKIHAKNMYCSLPKSVLLSRRFLLPVNNFKIDTYHYRRLFARNCFKAVVCAFLRKKSDSNWSVSVSVFIFFAKLLCYTYMRWIIIMCEKATCEWKVSGFFFCCCKQKFGINYERFFVALKMRFTFCPVSVRARSLLMTSDTLFLTQVHLSF